MTQERKDFLHLHFIVLVWGFSVIMGLLIKLPPVEVVFYRTLISSVGLWLVIKFRKEPLKIASSKSLWILILNGFLIAAHWILFFLSARMSNASVCLAGMATCSLWTSLIEPISQKRKVRGFEIMLSVIAFVGIGIIFNVEFGYIEALLIAVFSAFFGRCFYRC